MSNDISKIDKNFIIKTNINEKNIKFYDASSDFSLHGVYYNKKYRRIPQEVAEKTSSGVCNLCTHTAGGRVRFRTDSSYIAISCKQPNVCHMPHMALSGSTGFDLFDKNKYIGSFIPPTDNKGGFESVLYPGSGMHDITINFPLYNNVDELYIGLQESAQLLPPKPYKHNMPIVYYGSSITQGGCASRPGNSYQAIISRKLDTDYINLGFSGSCKGEQAMAEYISKLPMSIFVLDYDHNAPDYNHLENTHEPFFKTIRKENPLLPIIIISKPDYKEFDKRRRDTIYKTYQNAINIGDKNVYFIDGETLWDDKDVCSVDGCHPNDHGFYSMANVIGNVIEQVLH